MAMRKGRRGFTLIELLLVMVIIGLLAAMLLPAIIKALCQARQGSAEHLIDNLMQASKNYELDQNAYPPGDGTGSKDLALVLAKAGPKKLSYFEFLPDMLDSGTLSILNPVHAGSSDTQAKIIYYRNNQAGGAPGGGPTVRFKGSFDMWCAGCSYETGSGASAPTSWEVNNWE